MGRPVRDMVEPVGDMIESLEISWAREERRLMATLGEYMLPPYALVRRLE